MICVNCGHHKDLHFGPQAKCKVKLMVPGYKSFLDLPICGCVFRHTAICGFWKFRPCSCAGVPVNEPDHASGAGDVPMEG